MVERPKRIDTMPPAFSALPPCASAIVSTLLWSLTIGMATASASPPQASHAKREAPFVQRPLIMAVQDRWIGNGICYGPHRDGQRPGGPSPTDAQLLEDLRLLHKHWRLLRTYSARDASDAIVRAIRDQGLDMKVMLGVWIATARENGSDVDPRPSAEEHNLAEVEAAVRLANDFPDVVVAVCVGNETQVSWSAHRVPLDTLVNCIRTVRARTTVPVTTADDFSFWNTLASHELAREVDFLTVHVHPMWNSQPLEAAVSFTQKRWDEVAATHPGRPMVLGEAGWATMRHNQGEQARLIIGTAGEEPQATFFRDLAEWTTRERIVNFYFEAFDENWKGGPHPDEVEKHWGLFRADRTPKPVVASVPRLEDEDKKHP